MVERSEPAPHPAAKYENKDPRCTYPFEPNPIGYCWSYAHHVDGSSGFEDIENICRGCELWEDPTHPRDFREIEPREDFAPDGYFAKLRARLGASEQLPEDGADTPDTFEPARPCADADEQC